MKIGILTSSRADFGIYFPLIKKLTNEVDFEVEIIAFGTHLQKKYGHTIDEILNAGFEVKHSIRTSVENENIVALPIMYIVPMGLVVLFVILVLVYNILKQRTTLKDNNRLILEQEEKIKFLRQTYAEYEYKQTQKNHADEKTQRAKLLATEAAKLKELETKFGPKPYGRYSTGVPPSVYEYWNKTLKHPGSLEEERCGPIRAADNGWTTVCRYRVKNSSGSLQLIQDTFIIKDGIAHK